MTERSPRNEVSVLPDKYAPGMRDFHPDFCWRLTDNGARCCILDRGHDDGVHEFAKDEFWIVKSEGEDDDRGLAYWGPYETLQAAIHSSMWDDNCVWVWIPGSKRLVYR